MRKLLLPSLILALALVPALKAAALPFPASSAPQDQDQYQGQASYQPFSPDQLDNLLSTIALYPDPLLAQVLVAATFPDQVEEAARFVRANGPAGIDDQYWDISVKAIAHYPSVLNMMADKIDWTTAVGQAYVNQGSDVSAAVQRLRRMARSVGNLESTPEQEVLVNGDYIAIDPVQPRYIFVPVYDPVICYYRRPYFGPAIVFGAPFPIGAWLNLDFRWGYGGGWGGVFYTGWRPWGGWNGGWVERCRPYVQVTNIYVNNRYTVINVNRTVINRTVNVNNVNHYNYIHKNVTYDNVVRQNNFRGENERLGNKMNNNNPPPVNNKVLNRNIDTNNSRTNDFRGRENNNHPQEGLQNRPDIRQQNQARDDNRQPQGQQNRPDNRQQNQAREDNRPPQGQQNRPDNRQQNQAREDNRPPQGQQNHPDNRQQDRPQPQPRAEERPAPQNPPPHAFGRSEGNFNPNASSQRGQQSRQEMNRPAPPPPPQHPGGGGGGDHPKNPPKGGGEHNPGGRHP